MLEWRQVLRQRRYNGGLPTSSFTPISNTRHTLTLARLVLANLQAGLPADRAERQAISSFCAGLPTLPFARRHRAPRPSKSDSPAYRKCASA